MAPRYLAENRYAFVMDATRELARASYEVDTPETAFERDVQRRLVEAHRLLATGRPAAALEEYRGLRGLIGSVLYPRIPPFAGVKVDWVGLAKLGVAEAMIGRSAQMLDRTPPQAQAIPTAFSSAAALPAEMTRLFEKVESAGLADADAGVRVSLAEMHAAIEAGQFAGAAKAAGSAADSAKDEQLRAALLHDQAVLLARSGEAAPAAQTLQRSIDLFASTGRRESQIGAMATLAELQARAGDAEGARRTQAQVEEVRKQFSVFPVQLPDRVTRLEAAVGHNLAIRAATDQPLAQLLDTRLPSVSGRLPGRLAGAGGLGTPLRDTGTAAGGAGGAAGPGGLGGLGGAAGPGGAGGAAGPGGAGATSAADAAAAGASGAASLAGAAGAFMLMGADAFAARKSPKAVTILGESAQPVRIDVAGGASAGLEAFYGSIRQTTDLSLLMGYLTHHTATVAYLPHIVGWVLPMAIGDCHAALGAFEDAEAEYLGTLNYRFLNLAVESVTLWLRLADLYLDRGDRLYRDAANQVERFAPARAMYERVMRLDETIDEASPLYAHASLAPMRDRARAIIQAVFVGNGASDDNPRVQMALARARMQIRKIDSGLNFLGIGLQVPPFGFEYLQNVARYFAQHAAQVEASYIQFKSSGEGETLREQQMAQQASIATASVELERRGLTEAREGVDVASAGLNYATVQRNNAAEMRDRFNAVRWELQELDRLQAWAGSASNDEVKLNVKNATYYSADSKPRSHVLFDLANRRAKISHDLEAARLQNEIEAADAYRAMAQQQVQQAQARVAVAEQRIRIAALQAQYAQENLEFLKGREFSATMWYELAREARRIALRYLDMAIEVAVLMERAYEAETGRDLAKIKLDYGLDSLNGLLAADALLTDIDFFTLDYVRTKAKKAPMKQTLSLADHFPMAFDQLVRTGRALFETTLAHFDRRYPGFYLQKIKQVELLFIGLAGTEGVHGTLRNIGLSKFRRRDGSIAPQTYPADVMPLTDYDVRQDAVVFQLGANELRLFENNGIATVWQIEVPRHSNTFELTQILDVQMVLYYDGFFDPVLEANVLAALPAQGSGTRSFSLRVMAPDELFFLRSQGSARLAIDASMLPANQADPQLRGYFLQARGPAGANLKLRVDWTGLGAGNLFTLDAAGNADGAAFAAPTGRTMLDTLEFSISAADNPQLVRDGVLDLSGLQDLSLVADHTYTFRQ